MNNAGTSLFTGSRILNNRAINAPIGTTTLSTVVFNDTLIQENLAITALEYYAEAFDCVDFCYLATEFKEQTMQIINKTTLASSKAEIQNQQSTVMFDNNTLISKQNVFMSMFYGSTVLQRTLLKENTLIDEPFFGLIRSTLTIQGSTISDISSDKDLIFITGTEQSDITIATTSFSKVSFTSTLLDSNALYSGNTISSMNGTFVTAEVSNVTIDSCSFTDLRNDGGFFIQGLEAVEITVSGSTFEEFPTNSLIYLDHTQKFTSFNSTYRA